MLEMSFECNGRLTQLLPFGHRNEPKWTGAAGLESLVR